MAGAVSVGASVLLGALRKLTGAGRIRLMTYDLPRLPGDASMTRIQIFESARSEAGRNAQKRLEAMAEIARAREQGAEIEHYEFASDGPEFLRDAQVKTYIDTVGADALPLILVDGRQVLAGRYPTRVELAGWCGSPVVRAHVDRTDCCSGGDHD